MAAMATSRFTHSQECLEWFCFSTASRVVAALLGDVERSCEEKRGGSLDLSLQESSSTHQKSILPSSSLSSTASPAERMRLERFAHARRTRRV